MRHALAIPLFSLLLILALGACTGAEPDGQAEEPHQNALDAGLAEVLETMDSGGYTYARLLTGEGEVWVAAPVTPLAVGDMVQFSGGMEMTEFHAASLDRTFETIWFVGSLPKAGGQPGAAQAHGTGASRTSAGPAGEVEPGAVGRAEGGYTVAELYEKRSELAGQEVAVAGRVVKYNAGIMGKNWIHLQDGSGEPGANDLTVTTQAATAVGDEILVRGVLVLDRDFGAGYRYDLIVEDAAVSPRP